MPTASALAHPMPTLTAEIPSATLWPLSALGPPWRVHATPKRCSTARCMSRGVASRSDPTTRCGSFHDLPQRLAPWHTVCKLCETNGDFADARGWYGSPTHLRQHLRHEEERASRGPERTRAVWGGRQRRRQWRGLERERCGEHHCLHGRRQAVDEQDGSVHHRQRL